MRLPSNSSHEQRLGDCAQGLHLLALPGRITTELRGHQRRNDRRHRETRARIQEQHTQATREHVFGALMHAILESERLIEEANRGAIRN